MLLFPALFGRGFLCSPEGGREENEGVGRNPKSFHINLVIVQKNTVSVDTGLKLWYKHIVGCESCTACPLQTSRLLLIFLHAGPFCIQTAAAVE